MAEVATLDEAVAGPHVMFSVFARGLPRRAVTRPYYPDEEEANARNPVLFSIEDGQLRDTLVDLAKGAACLFDIRLQGEDQTTFFEFGE